MEWANQELERNVKMMERNVQQLEMGKHFPYSKEDGFLNVGLRSQKGPDGLFWPIKFLFGSRSITLHKI